MKIKYFFSLMVLIIAMAFLSGCGSSEPEIIDIEETPDSENTQVEPVTQKLLFSWNKDSGSRIEDGSVPFIHKLKDGRARLYYCNSKGILSAISNDGLSFTKEQGVRVSLGEGFESYVCDPTIVDLQDGRMRMYYKGADSQNPGPGQSIHKIYSAVSSDGLTFQKEGLRIDSETNGDNGWASVPDAIVLPDGRVRIYYVTAAAMEHGIGSAISSDGLNFVKESGLRISNLVDPALIRINNKYIIFAASIDERFASLPKGIYYSESTDGLDFSEPIEVFQESNVYDPSILKVDENTVRIFYGKVMSPKLPAVESHTGKIVG
ncbi:exo-alpha-sialidase [Candidatus Woesearchaeota archaeon]|nr:exo-alpha-sialidase [Candidatus Woesearchaeota archaeon]